jgi:hypothetical protein
MMMRNAIAIFDYTGEEISAMVDRMNERYGSHYSYSARTVTGTDKTEVVGICQEVMLLIGYAAYEGHDFLISYTSLS